MTDSGSLRGAKPDEAASATSRGSLHAVIGVSPSDSCILTTPSDVAGGGQNLLSRIKAAQERGRKIRQVMIGGTKSCSTL